MMIAPVKTLNLDDVSHKLLKDEYQVIFIPGHIDEFYIAGNKLIINFFKIMIDMFGDEPPKIDGIPLKEYVEEKLMSM